MVRIRKQVHTCGEGPGVWKHVTHLSGFQLSRIKVLTVGLYTVRQSIQPPLKYICLQLQTSHIVEDLKNSFISLFLIWQRSVINNKVTLCSILYPNTSNFVGMSRGLGMLVLVLSWVITLFTLHQLVEMHEMIPGRRFDRYHELGQEAFGQRLGLWIVVPQQLVVQVGSDIVYMLTGAVSLQYLYYHYNCTRCSKDLKDNAQIWILIFGSVHFVLSQRPNLNSITWISMSAAIMALRWVFTYVEKLHHYITWLHDRPSLALKTVFLSIVRPMIPISLSKTYYGFFHSQKRKILRIISKDLSLEYLRCSRLVDLIHPVSLQCNHDIECATQKNNVNPTYCWPYYQL